ncbi:MAG: hypothetical protein R3C14_55080 [Caldilineaceae bacterium]
MTVAGQHFGELAQIGRCSVTVTSLTLNYGVHCRYFKLAENALTREQLLAIRNIVSTLFLAKAHYDITLLLEEFVALFTHEEDKQAVSLLLNWFHQLVAQHPF